jgi:glycosyltransferase involved in cell wall biosynthesis
MKKFPAMKRTAQGPLKFLVLSAKGWGTGSALRAFYIAEALRKRGHIVKFVKPLPTLPLWLDMALAKPYTLWHSLFFKSDAALAVKPYPTLVPALWVQRLKGARIIFDVDDLDYAYSHGWFRSLHKWLQKGWPNWADIVTYHNPRLLEPIRHIFKVPDSKLVQIQQGVDIDIFRPGPLKKTDLPLVAADLLEHKKDGPILTFTAHLNNACDLGPVLHSVKLLMKSVPQARLLVAGGGPDEARFRQMARHLRITNSVHFTGMLTIRQVAACLKAGDLALAYYGPALVNEHRASMKLREALACGCKVVATDVGEAGQWKRALFLSKPDPAAFAQTIRKALKAKKSPQAAALLVKNWDWTRCVENLEKELSSR